LQIVFKTGTNNHQSQQRKKRGYRNQSQKKKKRGYRVCSSGYAATDTS
jgi:hypothetical protein